MKKFRTVKTRNTFIREGMCKCKEVPPSWLPRMKVLYGQEVEIVPSDPESDPDVVISLYDGETYYLRESDFADKGTYRQSS